MHRVFAFGRRLIVGPLKGINHGAIVSAQGLFLQTIWSGCGSWGEATRKCLFLDFEREYHACAVLMPFARRHLLERIGYFRTARAPEDTGFISFVLVAKFFDKK